MRQFWTILLASILPSLCGAQGDPQSSTYRWVDENGVIHYGDHVPVEASELEKQVINDAGITVGRVRGKKTEEELAAEQRALELEQQAEIKRRQDAALLATYGSVDEILMHRDRRVELFQAQARVTELYLRNLRRRLDTLQELAQNFRPYSTDPDAEMIDPGLTSDIAETRTTIARHEQNLEKFQLDEQTMASRFNGDIDRFKELKGL